MKELEKLKKEFRNKFLRYSDMGVSVYYESYEEEEIDDWLSKALEKSYRLGQESVSLPMGVSQWREHGKKHGYWDYFIKQCLPEERSDWIKSSHNTLPD